MNWPEIILRCFDSDRALYSGHARREMREEEFGPITDQEVYEAICSGEVIEGYPDDTPYPKRSDIWHDKGQPSIARCLRL